MHFLSKLYKICNKIFNANKKNISNQKMKINKIFKNLKNKPMTFNKKFHN